VRFKRIRRWWATVTWSVKDRASWGDDRGTPEVLLDGMPFFSRPDFAGAAFRVSVAAPTSHTVTVDDWEIEVRAESVCVVARGPARPSAERAFLDGLDYANRGLDMLNATGGPAISLVDAEEEYICRWRDRRGSVVRLFSAATAKVTVGIPTVTVTDASGRVVPQPPRPPERWHEALRFLRLSQTTDDLGDAFRNMYLALEGLLDDLDPQQVAPNGRLEPEGRWLRRALTTADSTIDLKRFLPGQPANAVDAFMNLIYEDLRTAVFHAKTSRPVVLPQSDPSARRKLVDGLRVLGEVVKALAEHQLRVRRPSGGIFASFWRMQTSGPAQRAKLAVTPTAELLHNGPDPADDPELVYLHTRPAPEYDFPFATSILGVIDGSAVADAGRLSHFYSFVDNAPWTGGTPDGALKVGSLSRLEILLQLRAENTRPLRTRFST
jgi:hypothetical protein